MADRCRSSPFGTIELVVRAQTVGGPESASCPDCHEALELHQPDATDPDRLLGTCAECSKWFILVATPTGDRALVLRLPTSAELQRAIERERPPALRSYAMLDMRGHAALPGGPCLTP
jgi:hypothetical protein